MRVFFLFHFPVTENMLLETKPEKKKTLVYFRIGISKSYDYAKFVNKVFLTWFNILCNASALNRRKNGFNWSQLIKPIFYLK